MEEPFEVNPKQKKWVFFLRQAKDEGIRYAGVTHVFAAILSNSRWIQEAVKAFTLMIGSGVWTTFFMVGQFMGAPTVVVPQLRKDSVELDDDMASWLYSAIGFASVPWVIILSVLIRMYGLRIPHIISCIGLILAYIVFYFSTTPLQICISEILAGIGNGSLLTTGIVIVSEYTSPEYRGIFLSFKTASLYWGIWCSNAIGTFFYWKNIAYSGFLCTVYLFSFIFWPESPQWLASRGRFDECRKAYYWLQGHNDKSEKEVEELIASQLQVRKTAILNNDWSNISTGLRTVITKEFYAPFLLTTLLVTQNNFTGKFVCSMYVIDIIKKMTDSESTAYIGMLILDGVTVFSMYAGCFLSKILNRRTLYFSTSFTGIVFLFMISLYLYLVKLAVIEESKVISLVLLTCFSISISCGPMIMNISIYAELIPLRFKNVIILFAGVFFFIFISILLKGAPYIFKSLGLHGTFLFYGITSGACTVVLYKYLPETKDKTLQEIELYFKTNNLLDSETDRLNSNKNKKPEA